MVAGLIDITKLLVVSVMKTYVLTDRTLYSNRYGNELCNIREEILTMIRRSVSAHVMKRSKRYCVVIPKIDYEAMKIW